MHHAACVEFLEWALPRLGLDWLGFEHAHRQVCKRLNRRLRELSLSGFEEYRGYVLDHDTEWEVIDTCCRVTVSRFYRDRVVFDALSSEILPALATKADLEGRSVLRAWSAGCGAGEEAYSLALAWRLGAQSRFPAIRLNVIGTDIDEMQMMRASTGCYRPGSLRELPRSWVDRAFLRSGPLYCLRTEFRESVEFRRQDLRADAPRGPFDLILCRNVAFTYFDTAQRQQVVKLIRREMAPNGVLVLGRQERLPEGITEISPLKPELRIYRTRDLLTEGARTSTLSTQVA